jgi:hypothetical protein
VDGEAVPDLSPEFVSEQVGERLLAVDVEVIDNQMDGFGFGVLERLCEFDAGDAPHFFPATA